MGDDYDDPLSANKGQEHQNEAFCCSSVLINQAMASEGLELTSV